MPSIDERRAVAAKLRDKAGRVCFDGCEVEECLSSGDWRYSYSAGDGARSYMRLADLIDPAEHERTVADNLKIIDRNRELEIELARAKRKLERTRRQAQIDNERAVLADKLEDENLELKKRLGCFDDVTPPVSWYAAMRERCERLERELAEAYRR